MRRRLARRLQRHARVARIVDAPAERLPLADASVDTVVSTLVLCTVDDPERALREIARVLRPDGQLLFIEHVRASSRFLAACQDYLLGPWRRFAGGCCCNRPTVELMRACGFTVAADDVVWRGMPAIVHPLVVGTGDSVIWTVVDFAGGLDEIPNANHPRKEADNAAADATPRGCRVDSTPDRHRVAASANCHDRTSGRIHHCGRQAASAHHPMNPYWATAQ